MLKTRMLLQPTSLIRVELGERPVRKFTNAFVREPELNVAS